MPSCWAALPYDPVCATCRKKRSSVQQVRSFSLRVTRLTEQ